MNLSCETILDFYSYRSRKVLCLIKVAPKSRKSQSICRTLSQEQWMTFDKELEKYIAGKNWNNENGLKFTIKPYVEVTVHKSKLSFKEICKCLGAIADYNKNDAVDVIESNIVLECVIEFQLEVALISSITLQEYEPQTGSLLSAKSLTYEPYTPSAKGINVSKKLDGNIIDINEDIYSPKPIFEIGAIEAILPEAIPKYIPAPIIEVEKHKLLKTKLSKSLTSEYVPESQEVAVAEVPIYIPTPIEEPKGPKLFRACQIRRTKNRSNTIDAFPEELDECSKEKQSLKIEVNSKEILSKRLKKRSMTTDEIPNELVDVINTPSLVKETKFKSYFKSFNHKKTKQICNATDELPGSINETNMYIKTKHTNCNNKRLRNRSTSVDDIQIEFSKFEDKNKPFKFLEEKNGLYAKSLFGKPMSLENKIQSSSTGSAFAAGFSRNSQNTLKTQTIGSDSKFEVDNKIDKSEITKELITNSPLNDIKKAKEKRKDRKVGGSSRLTKNSLTPSERPPRRAESLEEEQSKMFNKNGCKRYISSSKNKELFGTDDDDDDDFLENSIDNYNNKIKVPALEILSIKNPVQSILSSSSEKKKSKRENGGEGQKEECALYQSSSNFEKKSSKVLSIKTSTKRKSYKSRNTENRPKSVPPTATSFELPLNNEKRKRAS